MVAFMASCSGFTTIWAVEPEAQEQGVGGGLLWLSYVRM
jgi:hypothetical protein